MSNPRDDERRKFEAWAKLQGDSVSRTTRYGDNRPYDSVFTEWEWRAWLARAEQAETPQTREELEKEWLAQTEWQDFTNWLIHVKLCGSTPAPTELQAEAETPTTAQHCRNCGLRLAVLDGITVHRETLREKCPTMGNMIGSTNTRAAAPVEDRPLPSDPFSKGYKHRNGGPVSDACGEGKHAECTQDYTQCHCTYRGLHKTKHAYMTLPARTVAPEKE